MMYENMKMVYSSIILSVVLNFFFPWKSEGYILNNKNFKNHYIMLQTCATSFSVQLFTEISRKFCLKSVA